MVGLLAVKAVAEAARRARTVRNNMVSWIENKLDVYKKRMK
jgi:hypothetical protein